jgi:hypothetical protein
VWREYGGQTVSPVKSTLARANNGREEDSWENCTKHFCGDRLKVSETRDTIVFISMQNLQDVRVLNRDRDTVPLLALRSVLVVCTMPFGYKNKHNSASGCSYGHIWRIVDDSWCLSMWSEQVAYLNLEVGWMDQRIRVIARFEAEAYREDPHTFLLTMIRIPILMACDCNWITRRPTRWDVRYRFAKLWLKLV